MTARLSLMPYPGSRQISYNPPPHLSAFLSSWSLVRFAYTGCCMCLLKLEWRRWLHERMLCLCELACVSEEEPLQAHAQPDKVCSLVAPNKSLTSHILINEHADVVFQVRGVGGGGEGQQQRGNHDVTWPM